MKKCLLSILAGALLIVSCQNYDDQFDDLNSQITALASQVAGLSKVQSDLTALQGTVSSLQGNIASSVDSALASGLAGINAAVDNLQSQIDGIASSEEVAAIQSDVTAAQSDLTELLNNSNVFTGDLTVTTASQLNAALAYGTKIAIVNGNVDFQVDASMNIDSVQKVIGRLGTVVKDLSYVAATSSVSPVTFDNITGVTSLTIKQAGDYSFKGLESATNVFLNDGFKSKVKIIHFGALKTVTKFTTVTSTGSDDHAIIFPKVTELHLTSLARYAGTSSGNPLKLHIDEGTNSAPTVIAMGALEDKDASGKQSDLNLSIEGPNSVAITKITDGTIKVRNVITASVNGFTGGLTVMDGVQNFSADNVTSLVHSSANDLKTLDITGVVDPDTAAASQAAGLPAINFDTGNNGDIETIKIRGAVKSVTAKSAGSLTSVDLAGADVGGVVDLEGNTDLVTLDITGTKMSGVDIDTNADLESINLNGTFRAAIGGTAIDGSITVKDNSSLTSLTVGMAGTENLTITGNDDLTTIASTLTTVGATGKPAVAIYDNDFIATAVTDDEEAVGITSVEGKANDAGTYTTASGMETMKTYLDAVMGTSAGTAQVYWDSVESYKTEAGTETNDYVYNSATIATTKQLWIVKKEADNSVGALGLKKAKYAWMVIPVATKWVKLVNNSTQIFAGGTGETYVSNAAGNYMALAGNKTLDLASILNSSHQTRATATEATLTAALGGAQTINVTLATVSNSGGASGTVTGERYTTGAAKIVATSNAAQGVALLDADDYVTFTVGSNSVTATANATGTLAVAIAAAWTAKYGINGTASASHNASVTGNTAGVVSVLTPSHTLATDAPAVAMAVTASGTYGTSAEGLDWKIGSTISSADNTATSNNIIVMMESNSGGTLLNKLVGTTLVGSATIAQLTTTVRSNSVNALEKKFGQAAAYDAASARLPEDAVGGTASSAVTFTRTHWFN